MSKKERQKKEKKLINFSLVFSAVVILIEYLLAFVSKSNTLMMDSIFDIADLILFHKMVRENGTEMMKPFKRH